MKPKNYQGAGSTVIYSLRQGISAIGSFFDGLFSIFSRFSVREKILFVAATVILLILVTVKVRDIYFDHTILAPASGGEYVEVMNGEAKYFTPILAKSDPEKAISHLVYSALIKIDSDGQPQPDLATSWEISADGLAYTFHLRPGVVFQKGQPLSSQDVAATIALIKDENNKSPLRDIWNEVNVETPDDSTVVFRLPKKYGPFIYACTNEIISQDDAVSGSLTSNYNGTGPYSFVSALPDNDGNLEVLLSANRSYFWGVPNIADMRFIIAGNLTKDKSVKIKDANSGVSSFAGSSESAGIYPDKSFATDRDLVLFFNLRSTPLKDINLRKSIIANQKTDKSVRLSLVALDAEPQKSKAQSFADSLKSNGYDINVRTLSANDYAEAIKKRDYDLLMYGYDWSYDRDPYVFWHSSQVDKNNFDGYTDKNSDILIEDARLITDYTERNKRYDAFYQSISDNALAIYFEAEMYPFYLSDEVKGAVIVKKAGRPEDRFNNIGQWYLTEKRIRK